MFAGLLADILWSFSTTLKVEADFNRDELEVFFSGATSSWTLGDSLSFGFEGVKEHLSAVGPRLLQNLHIFKPEFFSNVKAFNATDETFTVLSRHQSLWRYSLSVS